MWRAGRQWVLGLAGGGGVVSAGGGLAPTYLQGCHADDIVSMIEESGQDVEYGRF